MQKNVIEKLRLNELVSDEEFDAIFPEELRNHSNRHYTSVFISQRATQFLVKDENTHILDIGSGTGKFCLVGAVCSKAQFTGVEYRQQQYEIAKTCAERFEIPNVHFKQANILDVNFDAFNAFYIFNPFLENIDATARMDEQVETAENKYEVFKSYVYEQLDKKPIGTRLASYWTTKEQVPDSYELVKSILGDTLRFWEKVK